MKLLIIPTTDWVGHPVPNRLNFIFDRLASRHHIDVCHFKIFPEEVRKTECNLVPMDPEPRESIKHYYITGMWQHLSKIRDISGDYDAVISANILPSLGASLQPTPVIVDYLDLFPESAAAYFSPPMDTVVKNAASLIDRINLSNSVGMITTSNMFKDYLKKRYDKPIRVIPNGVDTSLLKPYDPGEHMGYPVIGYVGSLERWIDLESIISSFPEILAVHPDARLLLVGPGLHTGHSKKLKKMAAGYEDRIRFTGMVPYDKLYKLISSMDVGLNPRKSMAMNRLTMGSKVLNYLACGVPVLTTNMPEIERMFHERDGVFPYHNKSEFFDSLEKALRTTVDPEVVKGYDWGDIAEKYEKAISSMIR